MVERLTKAVNTSADRFRPFPCMNKGTKFTFELLTSSEALSEDRLVAIAHDGVYELPVAHVGRVVFLQKKPSMAQMTEARSIRDYLTKVNGALTLSEKIFMEHYKGQFIDFMQKDFEVVAHARIDAEYGIDEAHELSRYMHILSAYKLYPEYAKAKALSLSIGEDSWNKKLELYKLIDGGLSSNAGKHTIISYPVLVAV